MTHYLLSVHTPSAPPTDAATDAATDRPQMTEEQEQQGWAAIRELEADMKSDGAWLFSGHLHGADTATVVRDRDGAIVTTDGPYAESKEHLGGFYVIQADDLDAALSWAGRVTSCVGMPIEVRPFAGFES